MDLTGLEKYYKRNYYELAQYLRQIVLDEVDIPVSIGVSTSKTLAKLASDKAKKCRKSCLSNKRAGFKRRIKKYPN